MRRKTTQVAACLAALLLALSIPFHSVPAKSYEISGGAGDPGISLTRQDPNGVTIRFEMDRFETEDVRVGSETLERIALSGVFLPNDSGAPDLPGLGRLVALPEGATPRLEIVSVRTQSYPGMRIAPAPVIPKETEDGPLVYQANPAIFQRDAFYPASPVLLSPKGQMRGVDVVTVGITPFQYNPVTRELLAYTEIEVRIDFEGGAGRFGEDRLRNRFWEPILEEHLINYASLPALDLDSPRGGRNGFEYVIITPDNPDFRAWADTLKTWRKLQGISTEVFTTTQIGGTTAPIIEAWLNNAYQTWDPAPAAFLILGDYPGSGLMDTGITAPVWNSYCVSDNIYADVDDDDMPDMIHARITARNADELQKMIGRMLEYERTPVTDAGFYDRPLIAGGWQTERWFILCCEIVLGHQANVLGKHPVREYAIYDGVPGSIWSSNPNTNMLVNYFGPNGLGYIPLTPQHLTDWSGNATRINNDLNAGSYFLLHRDHGEEIGWGEPRYTNSNLTGLHMGSKAPFVFSMNCLTGKYNWSSESFTEAFHRMAQGALGLVAASEISYSFVNDAYIFGLFDTMWPGFMPDYGPYPPETGFVTDLKPAFGMASGKYFLRSSNWPYNPGDKEVTYHLFHHHGDAFLTMNSEVPTAMAVTHDDVCLLGVGSLQIQAEAGAMIGLTVDGEIVGTAIATGFPQEVPIVPQEQPGELRVTVTKANRVRYDVSIPVIPPSGPYLVFDSCSVLDAAGDQDGEVDAGEATGLRLALENVGIEGTTGVSAVIASEDPLVEILTNENEFPNIPAGGIEHCSQPYRIHLLGTAPDQHTVGFTVTARANEGEWNGGFALRVQAPVLVPGNLVIDDSAPGGDGDGVVEPGETFFLQAWLSNTGHSDARSLIGMLSSTSPHVVIEDPEGASVRVPVGSNGLLSAFAIRVLPGCPSPAVVPLRIDVTNEAGFAATLAYEVQVGDWVDDVETDRGWALGAAGDNATTGQWVRVDPNGTTYNGQPAQAEDDHTAAGTLCFVTGQGSVGGAAGEADLDGGKTTLLTPVFDLGNAVSASIGYWRWYTNDLGNSPGLDWWDVDVTSDGTNWVHLEHTQASANSWNSYQFDLGAYVPLTSHVQLRFVAEDVSPGSLIEAAVDDFSLSATRSPVTGAEDSATIGRSEIVSLSPNPFNPRLSILFRSAHPGPVDLAIFDVGGRMVRSLVKGPVASGVHVAVFDGRDEAGRSLPSGIYFVRLDAADRMEVRQITLLK